MDLLTPYRRVVQRVGYTRAFAVWLRAVGARLDARLYRASGGRLAVTGPPLFPTMLLSTTGRRSGRPRTTPVIYHRDGERLIVSCEDTGLQRPAAWPGNLRADPQATVQIGATTGRYRARPASGAEIERYWPALLELWPAHDAYRRRTGRRHVFVFEPI